MRNSKSPRANCLTPKSKTNTRPSSGLGFAICQRLIDEFLTSPTRDPLSNLVLIVSTRSTRKTSETISSLRQHLRSSTQNSKELQKRAQAQSKEYIWREVAARVHFLGAEVDLCDLRGIYRFAAQIRGEGEGLSSPDTKSGRPGLKGVNVPRLDVLYLNAGIGGWTGMPWLKSIWKVMTGMPDAITYWKWFIFPSPAAVVRSQSSFAAVNAPTQPLVNADEKDEPPLGEIFCANVFGHYLLTHELMPLLSTPSGRAPGDRGRIVCISTLEPAPTDLSMDDLQGLTAANPYYGSKRLTDLLALTAQLPAVRPVNGDFYGMRAAIAPTPEEGEPELVRPEWYLTQPGIVNTNISGMNPFQAVFMLLGFYLARLLGSVWHPISGYLGAVAPVWVGLAEQATLDVMEAGEGGAEAGPGKVKWGSSVDVWAQEQVRRTEVPGWGWSGRVGEVGDRAGRARHAVDVTREAREGFEGDGRAAWAYMEGLRREWEGRLQVGDAVRKQ